MNPILLQERALRGPLRCISGSFKVFDQHHFFKYFSRKKIIKVFSGAHPKVSGVHWDVLGVTCSGCISAMDNGADTGCHLASEHNHCLTTYSVAQIAHYG